MSGMGMRVVAAFFLGWMVLASAASAEELVLTDGTVVKGVLVGYDHGCYQVRMGKFVKDVPEAQVATIRGGGVKAATAQAAGATAGVGRRTEGGPSAGAAAAAGSSSGGGAVAGRRAAGAGTPAAGPDPLEGTLRDAGIENPEDLAGSGGGTPSDQDVMSKILGGGATGSPADLERLQNNPMAQKLLERFKDPAYRDALLQEVESMQEHLDPGHPSPLVDKLQDLFGQLDAADRAPAAPAAPAAPTASAPAAAVAPSPAASPRALPVPPSSAAPAAR